MRGVGIVIRYKFLFFTLILISIISVGCSPKNEIGIVSEGIDVPDTVSEKARDYVQSTFDKSVEDMPENGYINWRIESLDYSYTYKDLDGMEIIIYQMNYEFLSETPENIIMAGGMYITEDNWVMPGYPNSIFHIFQQEENTLSYIGTIMINDSVPGAETFTNDIKRIIDSSNK